MTTKTPFRFVFSAAKIKGHRLEGGQKPQEGGLKWIKLGFVVFGKSVTDSSCISFLPSLVSNFSHGVSPPFPTTLFDLPIYLDVPSYCLYLILPYGVNSPLSLSLSVSFESRRLTLTSLSPPRLVSFIFLWLRWSLWGKALSTDGELLETFGTTRLKAKHLCEDSGNRTTLTYHDNYQIL